MKGMMRRRIEERFSALERKIVQSLFKMIRLSLKFIHLTRFYTYITYNIQNSLQLDTICLTQDKEEINKIDYYQLIF